MKIVIDKFNSDIFGIKMGNVVGVTPVEQTDEVKCLIEDASNQGYNHLNVKILTTDKRATNAFLGQGFELVDTQLMYSIPTKSGGGGVLDTDIISYREYKENDLEQIVNIAKKAYVLDQYHSDTTLDDSLCDKYYSEWIKNSCNGLADKVMIAEIAGNVVGYITLNYRGKDAVVGLAAVGEKYRGKGCFTSLIRHSLLMMKNEGRERLYYGTQLANIPVLKTMGRFSGHIEYGNHVMHRMIRK